MIFQNLKINNTKLKNRIVVSPMCQYSSQNGSPSKWHYQHLEHLSSTGASMILLESTAVDKRGKISDSDIKKGIFQTIRWLPYLHQRTLLQYQIVYHGSEAVLLDVRLVLSLSCQRDGL